MKRTEYDKDYHPQAVIKLMAEGYLDTEVMADWDISMNTFYVWKSEHKEFHEAIQIGYPKWETAWKKKGEEQAKLGNSAYSKYWTTVMAVKAAQGWRDAIKSNTYNNTTNVKVEQMNVLNGKSETALLTTLNNKLTKLGLPVIEAEFQEVQNEPKPE